MRRVEAGDIDALLPQTQCTRCGHDGCLPYAQAISAGAAPINRCPPGGAMLIAQLAALTERDPLPLDAGCGVEAPARLAWIDPAACIGCARCLPPCPVDAILGASRQLHTVIASWCTGCELCLPACPVDCIRMVERPATAPAPTAAENRARYGAHQGRRERGAQVRALELAQLKERATTGGGPTP